MNFSSITTKIRLKIFSELLILLEPIDFIADYSPLSPPLFRCQRDRLYPAILRVSRIIHHKASLLLYSNNHFQFPEVFTSILSTPTSTHISLFLNQIGSHARLIHYIYIPFPTFNYPQPTRAILHEAYIKNLELIQDTYIDI